MNQGEIAKSSAQENIEWHFIPPYTPHMGGMWEACVRSLKYHSRIAQVVHIRYFILKMSKILHRVRFIVGIFFPWSLILLRLFYADFVRFILSTLYGVFYRHCTVYFIDIVRFTLLKLYALLY